MAWDARPQPAGAASPASLELVRDASTAAAAAGVTKAHSHVHVPALDGVRGAAVLLVIIYHFANSFYVIGFTNQLFSALRVGWLGVDVFFALSGFLITGILLDTKNSPNYFKSFYVRRILRIFPLYYGAIALVLLLWAVLPAAGVWGQRNGVFSAASPFWTGFFLENLGLALHGPGATGVLTHYWSLAVEEHFYLIWPALVWLTSRRQLLAFAVGATVLSIVGRAAMWQQGLDIHAIFGATPLRLDGLAIGAIAAILMRRERPPSPRLAIAVLVGALAMLALLMHLRGTVEQYDRVLWLFAYPLASIATAAALVGSVGGGALAQVLSVAPLRWFGRYSYGLYVWHPIVGVLLFHSRFAILPASPTHWDILLAAVVAMAVNVGAAWLSFNLWEKRFLKLKRLFPAKVSDEPAAIAAAAGAPVVVRL